MGNCLCCLIQCAKFPEQGAIVLRCPRIYCIYAITISAKLLPHLYTDDVLSILFQALHYFAAQTALINKHQPAVLVMLLFVRFRRLKSGRLLPDWNVEP